MNKDYYYILGVKKESSLDEIKKAYRKLSLKFHPDKNEGDSFFEERFKDIQEAYETLSTPNRREQYDNEFNKEKTTAENGNRNYIPIIEYFKCNQNAFEYDKEVTFEWKCLNSDLCELKPFGKVPSIGSKTVKIKDFKSPNLKFELIAINNYLKKRTTSDLSLANNTYITLRDEIIEDYKFKIKNKNSNQTKETIHSNIESKDDGAFSQIGIWILIGGCILFIIIFLFILKDLA